jgi:hypothetical protein
MESDAAPPPWHIAECLLPGVTAASAAALTHRLVQELAGAGFPGVCLLGSLLMPEDEVLLCLFTGPPAQVRAVSERAGLPFERILFCVGLGWAGDGRLRDGGPATGASAEIGPSAPDMAGAELAEPDDIA